MSEWAKAFNEQIKLTVTEAPPGFKVRDVYLDEEALQEIVEATTASHHQEEFTLRLDIGALWAAVRVVDDDGIIWTTKDKGETWLNPFDRILS